MQSAEKKADRESGTDLLPEARTPSLIPARSCCGLYQDIS